MGWFSTPTCGVCGAVIKKVSHTVSIDGQAVDVCPRCFDRLADIKSKEAIERLQKREHPLTRKNPAAQASRSGGMSDLRVAIYIILGMGVVAFFGFVVVAIAMGTLGR